MPFLQFNWFSCDTQFLLFSPYDGFTRTKHVVEFLTLKIKAANFSETSVNNDQSTMIYISEDVKPHLVHLF